MSTEWIGYAAATLTTAAFVPQAVKILRSRDARSVSLGMYLVLLAGVALWCCYGVALGSWPIIAANVVTFGLVLAIVILKLRHG
jgi:MtN3 and saliva related transmembrane protein